MLPSTALGPVVALLMQGAMLGKGSYTPASYVKWLEMAGARVALVPYAATDEQVDAVFNVTQGALFIGGGSDTPASARRFYRNMLHAHAAGDDYPIWGTCDGFEWLMQIAADDDSVLTGGFDSENMSLPLNLTAAASASRLLADAAAMPIQGESDGSARLTVLRALATRPITLNNHHQGVTPHDFAASALPKHFDVLATNVDRKGRAFVSLVEGKRGLPVWATQFHPEKNIFEQARNLHGGWPSEAIAHSRAAVAVSQYFANFFVGACRGSSHRYATAKAEWQSLVYTHTTSTAYYPGFVQVYFVGGASEGAVEGAVEPMMSISGADDDLKVVRGA